MQKSNKWNSLRLKSPLTSNTLFIIIYLEILYAASRDLLKVV